MTMAAPPTGTGAIGVGAGQDYTVSWWAQKSVVGGPQTRTNMQWFDGAGVSISTVNGTNATAATTWGRHSQVFTAPVGAAFAMPLPSWSGTALVGQALDFAQSWLNKGAVASGPV